MWARKSRAFLYGGRIIRVTATAIFELQPRIRYIAVYFIWKYEAFGHINTGGDNMQLTAAFSLT